MTRPYYRGMALAAALAWFLPTGPSRARHAPEAPKSRAPRVPAERVTTELVLIETYVTDRKGRPVPGLGSEDFMLLIDGAEKPIASVEFRETPPQASARAGAGAAPPLSASGTPASQFPRRIILFFEDGTSAGRGLEAARRAADRFLSSGLPPADQVALAAFDRKLRILRDYTTDRDALRQTIAESLEDPSRISDFAEQLRARDEELERLLAVSGRHTAGLSADASSMSSSPFDRMAHQELESRLRQASILDTNYASEEGVPLARVLGAVRTLIDALAAWPGHKAIVFMGDGVPENPAQAYLDRILALKPDPELVAQAARHSLAPEIESVARAAAAAGVTIHTIQTIGLAAGTASDLVAARRRANSLATIALNTGGTASSSNDLLKALREAEAASRSYYVVGYAPEGPPDGRYHWTEVRLRDRNLDARVRSRRGFTRLTPAEARTRTLQAAHLLPELYRDLPADLAAVAGPQGPAGRVTDLVLHLSGESLLFLKKGDAAEARLEVGFIVQDDSGRETFRRAAALRLGLGPGGAGGPPGVNVFSRAVLPASKQTVTAVVLDAAAGVVGAARLALPAPATGVQPLPGLSLYSLAERSLWVELPAGADTVEPGAYAAGPALKTRFAPGEPLACGFRAPGGGPASRMRVVVRQADRTLLDLPLPVQEGEARERVSAPLPLGPLPPGAYELAIEEESAGGRIDRGRLLFEVVPPARGDAGPQDS